MHPDPRWFGLLLLAVPFGCADGRRAAASPSVEVVSRVEDLTRARGPALESGAPEVRVRRTLKLPADCSSIGGAVVRSAGQVTLRIGPAPGQGACDAERIDIPYTATISGLRPGRYNLRVVHSRAGSTATVVMEHPVVVVGAADPSRSPQPEVDPWN